MELTTAKRMRLLLICPLLFGVCWADDYISDYLATNGSVSDGSFLHSASRAAKWILQQRGEDYSWGVWTPRAVVALTIAEEASPLSKDDKELMVKQLNILLSLELGSDPKRANGLPVSRLALFINALYATCQEPRNFHGIDLIKALRHRTDELIPGDNFSLPIVFLPLCFAGEIRHKDIEVLDQMYHRHHNKTDLQAIELMAMSCISQHRAFVAHRRHFESRLAQFTRRFPNPSANVDVYTMALMFQAMHFGDERVDVSALLAHQQGDGSFGSLLATYYAIPALLGKNLLALGRMHCGKNYHSSRFQESPLFDSDASKVLYSLWVGEGDERDTHTITITGATNDTFYDIMRMAQDRNTIFRFHFDEMSGGKQVYSLAGIPNDVERESSWILHKQEGKDPRSSLKVQTAGVDRIRTAPGDHFIFWFKKSSPQ